MTGALSFLVKARTLSSTPKCERLLPRFSFKSNTYYHNTSFVTNNITLAISRDFAQKKTPIKKISQLAKKHGQEAIDSSNQAEKKKEKSKEIISPPFAKQIPQLISYPKSINDDEFPNDYSIDKYSWMQSEEDVKVQNYITKENQFADAELKKLEPLQKKLYKDMRSRLSSNSTESVPELINGYLYYTKFGEEGDPESTHNNFLQYCRKKNVPDAVEEVILDQNAEATKHQYIGLGMIKVLAAANADASGEIPQLVAYTLDTTGNECYACYIKDMKTGKLLETEQIPDVMAVEWGPVHSPDQPIYLYYTVPDEMNRPFQLWRHKIGTSLDEDQRIFEEENAAYFVDITTTKDKKYITVNSNSKTSSEVFLLDTLNTSEAPALTPIHPREDGVVYFVEHFKDRFLIVTNADGARNFKVVVADDNNPKKENWKVVVKEREDTIIEDFDAFQDFIVFYERKNGLPQMRVVSLQHNSLSIDEKDYSDHHFIPIPDKICSIEPGVNSMFDSSVVRFTYSTPLLKENIYEYDLKSRKLSLLRERTIENFDANNYECKQLYVPIKADKVQVPLTLIHRKELKLDSKNPVLMVGYGAYGHNVEYRYNTGYISLLKQGWIIALAHVRGGGELGTKWYEQGKLLNKKNSFTDFIACTDYLITNKYSSPRMITAIASSAGGLLLGAVLNMRPHLYNALILKVPFVDVISSMLDPDLPLTVHEYDEWGNPNDPEALKYMISYDPYKNIVAENVNDKFPSLLVTASMQDARVMYWGPVKWVAKLRSIASKAVSKRIILKIDEGGHFGDGGRFASLKEMARDYAFLINAVQQHQSKGNAPVSPKS